MCVCALTLDVRGIRIDRSPVVLTSYIIYTQVYCYISIMICIKCIMILYIAVVYRVVDILTSLKGSSSRSPSTLTGIGGARPPVYIYIV